MVRTLTAALLGLVFSLGAAAAQNYPDRPVKIVVGFTAVGMARSAA